jgi:MFS family permease
MSAYLTFDYGPIYPNTERVLEILADFEVAATFFIEGDVFYEAAAMLATFVLFVQEILLLDGFGFGLLLAAGSIGGVLGSVLAPNLTKRFGPGPSLFSTIGGPIVGFAVLSTTSNPVVVGACFAVYTFTAIMWNVVTVTLRQTLIPDGLLGRVNSVYRFLGWGAMPIGTVLGGVLVSTVENVGTREMGLRSPFVFALVVHVLLLVTVAPRLRTRTIEEAKAAAPQG